MRTRASRHRRRDTTPEPVSETGTATQTNWKALLITALRVTVIALDGLPIPGAKSCASLVLKVLEDTDVAAENETLLKRWHVRYQDLEGFLRSIPYNVPKEVQEVVNNLELKLRTLAEQWEPRFTTARKRKRDGMLKLLTASSDRDLLRAFVDEADRVIHDFLFCFEVRTWIITYQEVVKSRQLNVLSSINRAHYAAYDAARTDRATSCLQGTRQTVLARIDAWAQHSDPGHPPIFWLNGLAGIGKTTIAHTTASSQDKQAQLGGSFFFLRSDDHLKDARLVFPTLAWQLSKVYPLVNARLVQVLESDPGCVNQDIAGQFDRLILTPLSAMPLQRPLLIVLDALDECQPNDLTVEIIRALVGNAARIPFLRVLITSRPEAHIREALGIAAVEPLRRKLVLHEDIEVQQEVEEDIRLYLTTKLLEIWRREKLGESPPPEHIETLVRQSGKLFIYAATAVRFIGGSLSLSVDRQLNALLKVRAHHVPNPDVEPYGRLDQLYLIILQTAFEEVQSADPTFADRFKRILGSVVLLQKRLPLESLAAFLQDYKVTDIRKTLYNVHSILVVPDEPSQAIQTYHLSFPNFITNPKRCTYSSACVDPQDLEPHLFLLCVSTMKRYFAPRLGLVQLSSEVQQGGPDHVSHSNKDDIQPFNDDLDQEPNDLDQEPEDDRDVSSKDDTDDFYEGYSSMTPEVRYSNNHWCSHLVNIRADLDSRDATQTPSVPIIPTECLAALESFLDGYFSLWLQERVTQIGRTDGATKFKLAQDTFDIIHNAYRWLTTNVNSQRSITMRRTLKSEAEEAFAKLFPDAPSNYVFGHRLSSSMEKKPPLACLFCRERKIACGPPEPGSRDKSCNQCQRRQLECEYPAERRRGMRKKKTDETP